MSKRISVAALTALVAVSVLLVLSGTVNAEGSFESASISPPEATSNSIWYLTFVYKDEDGRLWDADSLELRLIDDWGSSVTIPLDGRVRQTRGTIDAGATFQVRMTAGLNLASVNPHPYMPDLVYVSQLTVHPNGASRSFTAKLAATYTAPADDEEENGDEDEEPAEPTELEADCNGFTVHDSHDRARYGGRIADSDYLGGYIHYDDNFGEPDPLHTIHWNGSEPDDQENPDDGTSASTYVFRVKYFNSANLPPRPYKANMENLSDYSVLAGFSKFGGRRIHPLGIKTVDWNQTTGVYLYIAPVGGQYVALPMEKEDSSDTYYVDGVVYRYEARPHDQNDWSSLPMGEYKYFFACSDDIILGWDDEIPGWLEDTPINPGNPWESSSNVDSYMYGNFYDLNCYVDRPTYQPGVSTGYAYPAYWVDLSDNERGHPRVDIQLGGYWGSLPTGTLWNRTVSPGKRVVHPVSGGATFGATTSTPLDFVVVYSEIDGISPEQGQGEINLWVNNGSNTKRYVLQRTELAGNSITAGVVYKTPTPIFLSSGTHTYYFTASNGKRIAAYPSNAYYMAYINHAPVLSNPSVTPHSGTAGDNFRFTVTYTDADNQRPYASHLVIKYGDGDNDYLTVVMRKLNPSDNNYADGCVYYFDSANLAHKLQPGWRKYRFEFTDDWGAPADPNDRVLGEKVYYQGMPNWIDGPFVSNNNRPVLYDGKVESGDGTANSATVWKYSVKYKDQDNHAPTYVGVFIGVANDSGGIDWDSGHDMVAVNPSDNVYSDGKEYKFATTLTGTSPASSYYYAFVASDGIDVAQYDETTSPSANAVWWTPGENENDPGFPGERLYPIDEPTNRQFRTTMQPLVGVIPPNPVFELYRYPIVMSSTGAMLDYDVDYFISQEDYMNGLITVATPRQYIDVQYLFGVPGPVSVGLNTPPSLNNGAVSPDPGTSSDTFVFSVTYRDTDGPSGQAPQYVRLILNGNPVQMTAASVGTPNYRMGARYEARLTLAPGVHRYYFEAFDGAGYAIYDANGNRSSSSPIFGFVSIVGPYVNDPPTLTNAAIVPNLEGGISTGQSVTYSVVYTDANNEPPDAGYPVVYIDNPLDPPTKIIEDEYPGAVTSVVGNLITDSSQDWIPNQFKGLPVQMLSGLGQMKAFTILSNTEDTLELLSLDLVSVEGIQPGDTFQIGKLLLFPVDTNDFDFTDGVLYSFNIPGLGEGSHSAHFMCETTELIGNNNQTRVTTLRTPEIEGPLVVDLAPDGNRPPILTEGKHDPPADLLSSSLVKFSVKYTDLDGDAPALSLQNGTQGYVRLNLRMADETEFTEYDMSSVGPTNWVTGVLFSYPDSLSAGIPLVQGDNRYYFTASDGWHVVRFPSAGELSAVVNIRPVLSEASVTPDPGNWGRAFAYKVKYTDANGDAPVDLKLVIDAEEVVQGTDPENYEVTHDGEPFISGRTYTFTLRRNFFENNIGEHTFRFTVSDGKESAVLMDEIDGPMIYENEAPVLDRGSVEPRTGYDVGQTYTYKVTYTDANGDEPEYIRVLIDGGGAGNSHDMVKVNPADNDYTLGVEYYYSQDGMPAGSHTYSFEACDWLDEVTLTPPSEAQGPIVETRPSANISLAWSGVRIVGQSVTVSGSITPAMSVPLTIRLTKPDGTVVNRNVNTNSSGAYTYTFTPGVSGIWTARASWAGNSVYLPSNSNDVAATIAGPSTTVNGLNMISVPVAPKSPFPNAVFGAVPPFAIAQYMPTSGLYKVYSLLPGIISDIDFPGIVAGNGYWIKTNQVKTITVDGTMVDTSQSFAVNIKTGWNMIGLPFLQEVNWGDIRCTYNGSTVSLTSAAGNGWVREYGWFYDSAVNTYKLVDANKNGADRTMKPWMGYWVRALVNCQLLIPAPAPSGAPVTISRTDAVADGSSYDVGWQVRLAAKNANAVDDSNFLGVAGAKGVRVESPRYLQNYVDVYFKGTNDEALAYDLKSAADPDTEWQVVVSTDTAGNVELTWEGIETMPYGDTLTLVDDETGNRIDMVPNGVFKFTADPGAGARTFRIVLERR